MLTDTACKNAQCPEDKPRARLSDAGGLYLEVTPNGAKRWFWKYRFGGKEKRLAIGNYSEAGSKAIVVSLKAAREASIEARRVLKTGTDPVQRRKADTAAKVVSAATTFKAVAIEFHGIKAKSGGWSATHSTQWLRTVEKHLFPRVGSLPLADVSAPVLLDALRKVEAIGIVRTAHDLREYAGQVFRYGLQTGRCASNPAADLRGALAAFVERNMGAVLEPAAAGELLRAIASYTGQPVTRAALEISALVFQRPGNVRMMEWEELDLDGRLWTIPAAKMKRGQHGKANGRPHLVPLAPQAVTILRELQPLTGHGMYVFPSMLSGERPMSENTIRAALRRMDYTNEEMTAHGFRAMARTLMVERLPGISADVIEAQLAHGKSGPLGSAYDRAEYMEQRRQMMRTWADYLDRLRTGAQIVPINAAQAALIAAGER
jgi:integrase